MQVEGTSLTVTRVSVEKEEEGQEEEEEHAFCLENKQAFVGMQVEGITLEVMRQALDQAKAGRQHILQEMQSCDPPPAKQLSQYAPRIRRFNIDPDKIGQVIGSGGRNIKMLQAAAGCDEIMVSVYQQT